MDIIFIRLQLESIKLLLGNSCLVILQLRALIDLSRFASFGFLGTWGIRWFTISRQFISIYCPFPSRSYLVGKCITSNPCISIVRVSTICAHCFAHGYFARSFFQTFPVPCAQHWIRIQYTVANSIRFRTNPGPLNRWRIAHFSKL